METLTSEAEAAEENAADIAAVNRCATQNPHPTPFFSKLPRQIATKRE
jgi:hypothetical protein